MKRDFLPPAPTLQEKIQDTAEGFEYRLDKDNNFDDEAAIYAASNLRRNIYPIQKIPIDLAQLTSMAGVIAVAISLIVFFLLKR
jgi:hypothetical protein